jgi:hypothetical protein
MIADAVANSNGILSEIFLNSSVLQENWYSLKRLLKFYN